MSASAISMHGVTMRYGRKTVLNDVSLEIATGESLAIIGPNGAGKTTLLKCLNRLLNPSAGDISLHGKPLRDFSQREVGRRIGYVPQADGRLFPFTVLDFVLMGRYPHLSPFSSISPEDKAVAVNALEDTGMASFAERSMDTLSGGEKQIVLIAAALAQGAEILLLDEPSTFLDYKHQVEVATLLKRLHSDGKTLITVTHDINYAVTNSTHVAALKEGELVFDGNPAELLTDSTLESIFDISFHQLTQPDSPHPVMVPKGDAE